MIYLIFLRDFKLTKSDSYFVNTSKFNDFIDFLASFTNLPLTNYFISDSNVKSILNYEF